MNELTFNFHYTDKCNFKCNHCFVKKCGRELDLSLVYLIIDKLYDWSKERNIPIRINLAGGEPLVSPNIQKIIDYIYSKNISLSIITNGYFLTKDFILKNKTKIKMIGLSVDSLDKKTNLLIGRCNGVKTLTNKQLIDLGKWIKNSGIKLKINSCISSLNINEDFKKLFNNLKPDRMKFLKVMTNHQSVNSNLAISDEEWIKFTNKYKNLQTNNEIVFEDNKYMLEHYMIIDSEGNLSKDNLHIKDNSLLTNTIESCLENIAFDWSKCK